MGVLEELPKKRIHDGVWMWRHRRGCVDVLVPDLALGLHGVSRSELRVDVLEAETRWWESVDGVAR